MTETPPKDHETGREPDTAPYRPQPKSPREAIQPEPGPQPPARSRHVRNPFVIVINAMLTIAVLGVLAAGGLLYWGKGEFDAPGPLQEEKAVVISSGSGLQAIADRLEREGVISDSLVFWGGVQIYKNAGKLKAGEYAFAPGSSMRQVMEDLVSGKAVYHTLTIPEGWTSAQIIERVREHPALAGAIDEIPAEGAMLPETYTFTRGMTRQQLVQQMVDAQTRALAEIWARRTEGLPVETPEELVILASVVEKETARADERPRVAGVFVNRLRKGMRLQSDPTILYGLHGGQAWTSDRSALSRADMDKPNPYNTYQINGLPPGPIGSPGRASMEAVANPSRTKDLYFVADGTGGHVFAETYEQHQRNVAKWRKIERDRRNGQEKEPDGTPSAGNGSTN